MRSATKTNKIWNVTACARSSAAHLFPMLRVSFRFARCSGDRAGIATTRSATPSLSTRDRGPALSCVSPLRGVRFQATAPVPILAVRRVGGQPSQCTGAGQYRDEPLILRAWPSDCVARGLPLPLVRTCRGAAFPHVQYATSPAHPAAKTTNAESSRLQAVGSALPASLAATTCIPESLAGVTVSFRATLRSRACVRVCLKTSIRFSTPSPTRPLPR